MTAAAAPRMGAGSLTIPAGRLAGRAQATIGYGDSPADMLDQIEIVTGTEGR
jgi:hypothetical protein